MSVDIRSKTLETIKTYGPISYDFIVDKLVEFTGNMHTPIALAILSLKNDGLIKALHGTTKPFYFVKGVMS